MGGRISFAFTGPVCVRAAICLLDVGWDEIEPMLPFLRLHRLSALFIFSLSSAVISKLLKPGMKIVRLDVILTIVCRKVPLSAHI